MITTAILPVAGRGSRMRPASDAVAKELMPVYDTPVLDFAFAEMRAAGITRVILVSHPSKKSVVDYANQIAGDINVDVVQQEEPLGLGHAVSMAVVCLREEEAVAVILPDDVIMGQSSALGDMMQAYARVGGGHMMAAMTVAADQTQKYGILDVIPSISGRCTPVIGMVEKPAPSDAPSRSAIVGRYILNTRIFQTLAKTTQGTENEIQLTDAIAADIGEVNLWAFQFEGTRYDCGSHDGLLAAARAHRANQDGDQPMAAE